ncbi:MAG: AraC family transcriptional regulator [Lachnospiraceae bacterium]|nr:AraC family transcriptional regulator [Lachnospiraceae bacterium]
MEKYVMKKNGLTTEITLRNAGTNAGKFVLYEICPGILFAFNEVFTSVLPKMTTQETDDCICTINYAASGTCGLYSSNGKYIYLRAGELMISNEQPAHSFEYPSSSYSGIEIYITRKALEYKELPSFFNIDIEQMLYACLSASCTLLPETYPESQPVNSGMPERYTTVIAENVNLFKNTINDIMTLYEKKILDLNLLRLHTFYLLRMLTAGVIEFRSGYESALSRSQVNMAKQAERLLTSNLMSRETIANIAGGMGISATSLKNYFRAVYGQNISEYLKEKRIDEAKKLLVGTNLSILEIANRVGFESQSKFTAMFHAAIGLTPTAFRQSSRST